MQLNQLIELWINKKIIKVDFRSPLFLIKNEIEDTAVIKINSSNINEKQLIVTIIDKGLEGTPAEN